MSERETPPPSPQELLGLKDEISTRFEQLPPQHQASMALVIVSKVFAGEYGEWMQEALALVITRQDILARWQNLNVDSQRQGERPIVVGEGELRFELDPDEIEQARAFLAEKRGEDYWEVVKREIEEREARRYSTEEKPDEW